MLFFLYILRTIYLGETFQSYLRIQNIGPQPVSNVSVKVNIKRKIVLTIGSIKVTMIIYIIVG